MKKPHLKSTESLQVSASTADFTEPNCHITLGSRNPKSLLTKGRVKDRHKTFMADDAYLDKLGVIEGNNFFFNY